MNGSARRWPRLALGTESLLGLTLAYLALTANTSFWRALMQGREPTLFANWWFGALVFLLLLAGQYIVLALLANQYTTKVLVTILLIAGASVAHFVQRYGIVIDSTMITNVLHTDAKEARELFNFGLFRDIVLYGGLPALFVWWVRLSRRPLRRTLLVRTGTIVIAAVVAIACLAAVFQDLGPLMRNRKEIRYLITPANLVWSLAQSVAGNTRLKVLQPDPPTVATRTPDRAARTRPSLVVIVVGETARAANFSLNGYARPTNPLLSSLDLVNFPHAQACGTSTEVSLPCLFSSYGRANYDETKIRRHDSLLQQLSTAGVRVIWRDNQSGCKGVCRGVETHQLDALTVPGLCAQGRCFDDILLHGLEPIVKDNNQDLVVVLHQLGNHGPAYHLRYPPAFARFQPACETSDLHKCTREEVVNAYDNAILYTDQFLANVITFLDARRDRYDTAMMYVSDHGESLGERGLWLHGMPYAIAPREQLEVPMFWWFAPEFIRNAAIDRACLQRRATQPVSHDNVFHSVMGLLDVRSEDYRAPQDLFAGCRASGSR